MLPEAKALIQKYASVHKKGLSVKEVYEVDLKKLAKALKKVASDIVKYTKLMYKEIEHCQNVRCISLKATWYLKHAKPLLKLGNLLRKYLKAQMQVQEVLKKQSSSSPYSFLVKTGLEKALDQSDLAKLFNQTVEFLSIFEDAVQTIKDVPKLVRMLEGKNTPFENIKEQVLEELKSYVNQMVEHYRTFSATLQLYLQ